MSTGKSYTLLIKNIPCINCITLAICRGRVLNQPDEGRKRETTKWLCNACDQLYEYVTTSRLTVNVDGKTHKGFSYGQLNKAIAFFNHPHDGKELI